MASTLETRSVYRTVRTIASGGMGRVDLVVRREGSFARAHALKRLHPELASNGAVRAMILDEARIAGLVRHANVVSVLDVGEDEEGPFLLMELVEGVSLSRLIASSVERSELLPLQICMNVARQIAEGLHAAHELHVPGARRGGVVHSDVSPSNVLLGFDGGVRVTDFGIARALDRTSAASGALIGKPGTSRPSRSRTTPSTRAAICSRSESFSTRC